MADEKKTQVPDENGELVFVEKPLRKPDARVYGRLEKWNDSDFQQFVPTATGTGNKREVIKSSGRAKLVKNDGEKDKSYSLYVNRDANDERFADKMIDDVLAVLKDYIKKEVKLPNAKFIHDDEAIKMWRSVDRGRIVIHSEIDLNLDKNLISREWGRISYEVSKLLYSTNFKKK